MSLKISGNNFQKFQKRKYEELLIFDFYKNISVYNAKGRVLPH